MAKKKKQKQGGIRHFFYHTRAGFYILVLAAIIGFTTTINAMNEPVQTDSIVLGSHNDRPGNSNRPVDTGGPPSNSNRPDNSERGRNNAVQERREQRQEEHREEIRQRYNVEPEGLQVEMNPGNRGGNRELNSRNQDINLPETTSEELEEEIVSEFENANEAEISSRGGNFEIRRNRVRARSDFPLSIDAATGGLTVTRPDGTQKQVTVLPDEAVQNFMNHSRAEVIRSEPPEEDEDDESGTESADTTQTIVGEEDTPEETQEEDAEVNVVEREDEFAYEIEGRKRLRVLGFIPFESNVTGYVSTETGDVIDTEQSFFDRIIGLISIEE